MATGLFSRSSARRALFSSAGLVVALALFFSFAHGCTGGYLGTSDCEERWGFQYDNEPSLFYNGKSCTSDADCDLIGLKCIERNAYSKVCSQLCTTNADCVTDLYRGSCNTYDCPDGGGCLCTSFTANCGNDGDDDSTGGATLTKGVDFSVGPR